MHSRGHYFLSILTALALTPALASSILLLTPAAITGTWQLHTACMNDHGKPGACIEMKAGSLLLTFEADGKWRSVASDASGTKKAGTYAVHERRLTLKNADGSLYQDWQPELSDDGQQFFVINKKLIETFTRVNGTYSPGVASQL